MNFYRYELQLLWRSRAFRWLLLIYLAAALATAIAGIQRLESERHHRQTVEAHYQSQLQRWRDYKPAIDPGALAYYLAVPAWHAPSPWAALIAGERHEHVTHLRLSLLAVQGQLYGSELHNHEHLPTGKLDLAFVWIYLLPLLIGVLCINLLAEEKSAGRWPLIASQIPSSARLVWKRLLLRFTILAGLNTGLLILAGRLADIPFDRAWLTVLGLLLLYQLFWFVVAAWIIRLGKNATFNALTFFGVWMFFAFFIPGLSYLVRIEADDLNNGIHILLEQRQLMHDSWDKDKTTEFAAFLEQHPEWRPTAPLPEGFHWKWYYAMQQMSDEAVAEVASRYRDSRISGVTGMQPWFWLSPVMNLQFTLSRIADADALAYQDYLDQVQAYHRTLRGFYYPYLFYDLTFSAGALDSIPEFAYTPQTRAMTAAGVAGLLVTLLIFCALLLAGKIRAYSALARESYGKPEQREPATDQSPR